MMQYLVIRLSHVIKISLPLICSNVGRSFEKFKESVNQKNFPNQLK